jgi:flavin reductase (DIM6/NTAB) family NADH-FMN oxidoreductase RutF
MEPSRAVEPPRVGEAPVSLEMRLHEIREYGEQLTFLVVGEVVHIRVAKRVFHKNRISPELLHAVGRLAGSTYTPTSELFDLERPTYKKLIEQRHGSANAIDAG